MTNPNLEQPIDSLELRKIIELIHLRKFDEAKEKLEFEIANAKKNNDKVLEVCLYSIFGMFYRLENDYKTAWRYYEKGEKVFPEDPSLKILSARLLCEVFGQYETAIKKCEKAIKLAGNSRPLIHQAEITLGLVHLKKGNRKKSLEFLEKAMANDFREMVSAKNIDFKLVEALLLKKIGLEESRKYIEKALRFAEETKDEKQIEKIAKILNHLPEKFE